MSTRSITKTGAGLVLGLMLFATACSTGYAKSSSPASSTSKTTTVSSASSAQFGRILTDAKGMTLYFFDDDKATKPESSCVGGCAEEWPPVLGSKASTVGKGLDPAKLGTTTRSDGDVQLTYNNWPLYRFVDDTAAGDITGQGIERFHVAGVDGTPVTASIG